MCAYSLHHNGLNLVGFCHCERVKKKKAPTWTHSDRTSTSWACFIVASVLFFFPLHGAFTLCELTFAPTQLA